MPKSKSPRKGKGRGRKSKSLPPKPRGLTVRVSEGFASAAAVGDTVGMNIAASLGGFMITSGPSRDGAVRKFRKE